MLGIQKFRTCCSRLLMVVPHSFFCSGWAQGFCLRWSIPTDAWLGLGGCFCGCFLVMHGAIDEPIKMIQQGAAK